MKNYLYSIIIPVYNVKPYLERCLESVTNQTYKNIQIILVDDGSSDGSEDICDKYAVKDSRISVLHKKNGGSSSARNLGLSKASGDYILFVDSDDYIEKNSIQIIDDYLNGFSEPIEILVGVAKEINGNRIFYQKHTNLFEKKIYTNSEYIKKSIEKDEFYDPVWLNIYNTKWFKKNKLLFTEGIMLEDFEIQPKIFLSAQKIAYIDFPFYNYIRRSDSIMGSENLKKKQESFCFAVNSVYKQLSVIKDKKLRRIMYSWLSALILYHCRTYRIPRKKLPKQIKSVFLLKHSRNLKAIIKFFVYLFFNDYFLNFGIKSRYLKKNDFSVLDTCYETKRTPHIPDLLEKLK